MLQVRFILQIYFLLSISCFCFKKSVATEISPLWNFENINTWLFSLSIDIDSQIDSYEKKFQEKSREINKIRFKRKALLPLDYFSKNESKKENVEFVINQLSYELNLIQSLLSDLKYRAKYIKNNIESLSILDETHSKIFNIMCSQEPYDANEYHINLRNCVREVWKIESVAKKVELIDSISSEQEVENFIKKQILNLDSIKLDAAFSLWDQRGVFMGQEDLNFIFTRFQINILLERTAHGESYFDVMKLIRKVRNKPAYVFYLWAERKDIFVPDEMWDVLNKSNMYSKVESDTFVSLADLLWDYQDLFGSFSFDKLWKNRGIEIYKVLSRLKTYRDFIKIEDSKKIQAHLVHLKNSSQFELINQYLDKKIAAEADKFDCILEFIGFDIGQVLYVESAIQVEIYSEVIKKLMKYDVSTFKDSKLEKNSLQLSAYRRMNLYQKKLILSDYRSNEEVVPINRYPFVANIYQMGLVNLLQKHGRSSDCDLVESVRTKRQLDCLEFLVIYDSKMLNSNLAGYLSKTPYLHEGVLKTFAKVLDYSRPLNEQELTILARLSNRYSFKIVNKLLDLEKLDFLPENLADIEVDWLYPHAKECLDLEKYEMFSQIMEFGPQLESHPLRDLALRITVDKGLPLNLYIAEIMDSNSRHALAKALAAKEFMIKEDLQEIAHLRDSGEKYSVDSGKSLVKLPPLDSELSAFIEVHPEYNFVRQMIASGILYPCLTPGCSYLHRMDKKQSNIECESCQRNYCSNCKKRAHGDSCAGFAKNDQQTPSRLFPGLPNFRNNLSNLCFFNAGIKMLAKTAADVPAFKKFLNPRTHVLTQDAGEGDLAFLHRKQLQNSLYTLIQQVLSGFAPRVEPLLSSMVHAVLNDFNQVCLDRNHRILGVINRDQFDSNEFLIFLLDFLEFEKENLYIEHANVVAIEDKILSSSRHTYKFIDLLADGHDNIQEALEFFHQGTALEGANQFEMVDGSRVDAEHYPLLVNAPDVMFFQVMHVNERGPSDFVVDKMLSVPLYQLKNNQKVLKETLVYKKIAQIVHIGSSADSGHYTCITWDDKNTKAGFLHDDQLVEKISNKNLAKEDSRAYIVAYKLKNRKKA